MIMNIVFDNIVYSLQKAGGISVVWQELTSRFLLSKLDDVFFIEHKNDTKNIFRKLIKIPRRSVFSIRRMPILLERYLSPKLDFDVPFIFHSSYYRICNNKNAINVTTVHDFTYDYYYKGKRLWAFLHIWQRNRAIIKSDAVVCISENTKNDLLKFIPNINPQKIHVIYNGVSSEYKILPEKEIISEFSECILFVGQRTSYKNGCFFINALKNTKYKVVFCGPKLSSKEVEFLNSIIGKDRYKSFFGLSNRELNIIYNSCKCLVYPSSYEGFGIPVIEAQSAGCPVIAFNASSIPEIIGDTTLLMNKLTEKELLDKIELLNDNSIRNMVITKGLLNAKSYSWDNSFNKYRLLYQNLLNSKSNEYS